MISRSDFPKDFLWGTATSAYQIEGAANEDGKGPSIWDVFSHTPGKIYMNQNADIATDHYHRYEEDIKIMKEIGLNAYRFSISWPRVMPDGRKKNEKGMNFYEKLVDKLLENEITPFITLYHWDYPYALYERGIDWTHPDSAFYFRDYAAAMFERLGDRVKLWTTHNEPWCAAFLGYYFGEHAPGHKDLQEAIYAAHNILRSHALALEAFREIVKDGKIGIVHMAIKVEPASDKEGDIRAAELADQAINGWFLQPLKEGKYPEDLRRLLESKGIKVPDEDLDIAAKPMDLFGVNYYTRLLIKSCPECELGYDIARGPLPKTEMGWEIYPQGLYDTLKRYYELFEIPLYITENGIACKDEIEGDAVNDECRIDYLKKHFEMALKALKGGVDLKGYFIWSLLDNFEWTHGYSKRFGIVYVDYKTLRRIPKKSAIWLKEFLKS